MPRIWIAMVFAPFFGLASEVSADSCSDKCSVNLLVGKITDSVCVAFCRGTGFTPLPLPRDFPSLDPAETFEQVCASKFETWTARMVAGCKLTTGFSATETRLGEAIDILVNEGGFTRSEFDGIEIEFCNLPLGGGLTPNSEQILLSQDFRGWTGRQLAPLLGHEMVHVRQYRDMGYDGFACEYSKELIQGRGLQCSNKLEKPAYEFECALARDLGVSNACHCAPPEPVIPPGVRTEFFGQFDGRRGMDVIQFQPDGRALVRLSQTTAFGVWRQWGQGHRLTGPTDRIADMNGDGLDDTVQFQPDQRMLVSLSNGTSFGEWQNWGTGHDDRDLFGNFDGRGGMDVIQFQPDGRALVRSSTESGLSEWRQWGQGHRMTGPTDRIADMNGDGLDDIVQFQPDQRMLVSLSNGTSFGEWQNWGTGHRNSDHLEQIDDKLGLDVVQLQPDGRALVGTSSGNRLEPWVVWGFGHRYEE